MIALVLSLSTLMLADGHAAETSARGGSLDLNTYLKQVREDNPGVRGAVETATGAELHSEERDLVTSPMFFVNAQYSSDGKPAAVPLLTYDTVDSGSISTGFSWLTRFGTQARLYYSLLDLKYTDPVLSGNPNVSPTLLNYYGTATTLEITQSLWGNGFGRSTRAAQDLSNAQSMATSYGSRFEARSQLVSAETAYWRLVTARQAVKVTGEALSSARKTYDWASRRVTLHLADQSDLYQAEAALNQRKLELQSSEYEVKDASRAFNSLRNIISDVVPESLPEVNYETVSNMKPTQRAKLRDDVKAAGEKARATVAGGTIAIEQGSPVFEVYGALALNGRDYQFGESFSQSTSFVHPTKTVGVRFTAPLDLGTIRDAKKGWHMEQQAAELAYDRKVFEQEQSWNDLDNRLSQSRQRLELARSIEKIQENKIVHERSRLKSGRSTTYQVLAFEQDYLLSQLNRIRIQFEVLGILTQMKLFGEQPL